MEQFYKNVRDSIVYFKLDLCCFVARVRVGILLFGYFNFISSVMSLLAVATESFPPLYMHAQQVVMEGEYVKSVSMLAYCPELCATTLLLCGMYREDVILLKYFTYVAIGMATCTLVVYAMILGALDMLTTFLIYVSLCYQVYLILLVRSVIVEIKEAAERSRYRASIRPYDVEARYYVPQKKYSVIEEPDTPKELEDLPVIPVKTTTEPGTSKEVETNEITKEESTANEETKLSYPFKFVAIKIPKEAKPGTSKEVETINEITKDEKSTANEKTKLKYPFKFVATKIPKEGTSKEKNDKNEENVKKESEQEASKDVKSEIEKTDEEVIREIIKPRKKSVFGRLKKEKGDSSKSKTTVDESKMP